MKLSPKKLHNYLKYDPKTGKLFWKNRSINMFSHVKYPTKICNSWNTRFANKEAFTYIMNVKNCSYRTGAILLKLYLAHQVIWAMKTGSWPKFKIDHLDGNGLNNKFENLRDVSQLINTKNSVGKINNTSGITGVRWRKERQKWSARIMINYKEKFLGYYDSCENAKLAYKNAARNFGFTERHGSFNDRQSPDRA